eukprot:CAMPEP_0194220500 /NCGR_PEP_ID=MMETSP0156-20130528/28550_1 /TAXON_ID=33649 /ORGANISM="Thalassionema nitzschioides, Strain L26-B" /LENGTH=577 /DNA_ID=CAMNT_0038950565 /DNA_START=30 /DNA_END=1763 /DNA_ORIENTATION=+
MTMAAAAVIISLSLILKLVSSANPTEMWGYRPKTDVTDFLELDLDKASMDIELRIAAVDNYESAYGLYAEGGFSHSYAEITLSDPQGLRIPLDKGTSVEGTSNSGQTVNGEVMRDLDIGEVTIPVRYKYPPYDRGDATTCVVGSLPSIGIQVINGCLIESGTALFGIGKEPYQYYYNVLRDNNNEMTMKKLSSMTEDLMLVCENGCPHSMFYKYFKYYKVPDYSDRWVTAAFNLTNTVLYRGNANFTRYIEKKDGGNNRVINKDAQTQAIKIATLCLNIWMYITYKMDLAMNSCDDPSGEPDIASWDAAFALFTGSLDHVKEDHNETVSGNPTKITRKAKGHMFHSLTDELCTSFRTCDSENGVEGPSTITVALLRGFRLGQEFLTTRECQVAKDVQRVMQNAMVVPLLQALLLHTYERIAATKVLWSEAKSTAYAAAVLPVLHACSESDAQVVHDIVSQHEPDGSSRLLTLKDFQSVKKALERNYECLGITCVDVGGLWDQSRATYMDGATPCHLYLNKVGKKSFALALLGVFGALSLMFLVVFLVKRWGIRKKQKDTEVVPLTIQSSPSNLRNIV